MRPWETTRCSSFNPWRNKLSPRQSHTTKDPKEQIQKMMVGNLASMKTRDVSTLPHTTHKQERKQAGKKFRDYNFENIMSHSKHQYCILKILGIIHNISCTQKTTILLITIFSFWKKKKKCSEKSCNLPSTPLKSCTQKKNHQETNNRVLHKFNPI